jgi:hypothetical protein
MEKITDNQEDYIKSELRLEEIVREQVYNNEQDRNKYNLVRDKTDLKLQLEKAKNLMDMRRIATIYIEDGKAYITTSIVYSNALGLFAKPILRKKIEKAQIVEDINELVYPNGDIAPLLVFDEKNVKSIKLKNSITESMRKMSKDFQDSLDMLEKRFLAKRMGDLYTDKWSIGIVFVLGGVFGYFMSKTLKF